MGLFFFSTRAAFQVLAFVSFDLSRDWRHWHCSGRWSTLVSFHLSSGQCCCETLPLELIYAFFWPTLLATLPQAVSETPAHFATQSVVTWNSKIGGESTSNLQQMWTFGSLQLCLRRRSGNRSCLFGLLPAWSDCPADGTNIRLVFDCVFQCTF